jgi:ribonucleotide reductase beta subunit family protein with ferritin-like domain
MPSDLLNPDSERFVLFPIRNQKIWNAYKQAARVTWFVESVDISKDYDDYWTKKLTSEDRHFISHVLAFFAASDGIVAENLATRFMRDVYLPEARAYYAHQTFIETIHSEMYSLLIDTLIRDKEERTRVFRAIETMPCVASKAAWAQTYIEDTKATFAERLVAFATVEGIFFCGSFCAIYWLKKRGLMPGLCTSNEYISTDELGHTDFACLLYHELAPEEQCRSSCIIDIIMRAVVIEKRFVVEAIPVSLIGMNSNLMSQYIEFVADGLLAKLGVAPIYKSTNPFPWMDLLVMPRKANFFEHHVTDYVKSGVGLSKQAFKIEDDF